VTLVKPTFVKLIPDTDNGGDSVDTLEDVRGGPEMEPATGVIVNVYAVPGLSPVYTNPGAVAVFEDPSDAAIVYDVAACPTVQLIVTLVALIFVKFIPETELGGVVIGPEVVGEAYCGWVPL
jgi:hypothetical protein